MTRTEIARLALTAYLASDITIDDAVIDVALAHDYDIDVDGEVDEIAARVRQMVADHAADQD
jgi:hypothetical protein